MNNNVKVTCFLHGKAFKKVKAAINKGGAAFWEKLRMFPKIDFLPQSSLSDYTKYTKKSIQNAL